MKSEEITMMLNAKIGFEMRNQRQQDLFLYIWLYKTEHFMQIFMKK